MGANNSLREDVKVHDYTRNWVEADESDAEVPYQKNINRYGDSDYDDELDPVDILDSQGNGIDPNAQPSLHSKDGKAYYDDHQQDDSENENVQLIDKSQSSKVPKMDIQKLDEKSGTVQEKSVTVDKQIVEVKKSTGDRTSRTARTGMFQDTRDPRCMMDPQAAKALETDLITLSEKGDVKFNKKGLLSFNRFMHLFIIITRHSKEQFIKEQRKVLERRRRAFKLKDWKGYDYFLQHEVDMERFTYREVLNFVLNHFSIPDGCYRASFVKYSMNRDRDLQMKDARSLIMKDIDERELENIEFNEEMIDRKQAETILKFYEARKLDVLSILSNPFKHHFGQKDSFVLGLAVEQAKIEDQVYLKYGQDFKLFLKACQHYGMMKSGRARMTKDALVIGNNMNMNHLDNFGNPDFDSRSNQIRKLNQGSDI